MPRPVAVAITGGIGAGKSEALAAFERHGAAVVSSDEIVHQLLREDDDVKRVIVERFGEGVLDEEDEIDRGKVGAIVFNSPKELAWLEELLHPLVSTAYLRWRELLAEDSHAPRVCVTEVPLLYETGSEARFDVVVGITAAPSVRAGRLLRPDLSLRERRLIPDNEKLRRADYSYVNDGTLEELDAFVVSVLEKIEP